MKLTKTDMARVIVAALHNLHKLPPADHPEVIRRAARGKVATLRDEHKLAIAAIESTRDRRELAK